MAELILDGVSLSQLIKTQIARNIRFRGSKLSEPTEAPCLAVVSCSNSSASRVYAKKMTKSCDEVGITSLLVQPFEGGIIKWSHPKEHLLSTIDWLNNDPAIHGILVQLPLNEPNCPNYINQNDVFDKLNPLKDVDVLSPINAGLLSQGRPRFIPCTPQAIQKLLTHHNITIAGKRVVIINRSDIVGKPLSSLLIQDNNSANATVCVCHDNTSEKHLKEICLNSDIIVVAVGCPNFLTKDMVHDKSIIIDVGINEVDGKIVGDVAKDAAEKAYAISPVPGGVGPMTVAMLLENTVAAQHLLHDLRV